MGCSASLCILIFKLHISVGLLVQSYTLLVMLLYAVMKDRSAPIMYIAAETRRYEKDNAKS